MLECLRGFFLGYRYDETITDVVARWFAVAAVVGIFVLLFIFPIFFRIELR